MTVERLHIGVVDDDAPVRTALSRLLRSAGFDVTAYGSAEEFLRRTQEHGVACLVLDLHLPHLGGLELQRTLECLAQHVPIVFITADHEMGHSIDVERSGSQCLLKPVDGEALFAAIEAACQR